MTSGADSKRSRRKSCNPDVGLFCGSFRLFEQYIKYDTKKNRILDKCYGNIKHAYTAIAKLPLSKSDNTVHLIPTCKTGLKKNKPMVKSISAWTNA